MNSFKKGDKVRFIDSELNQVELGYSGLDLHFNFKVGSVHIVQWTHGSCVTLLESSSDGWETFVGFHYTRFELVEGESK